MHENRIFYYDFLRAFAIIAVIMCHIGFFFGSLDTLTKIIYHDSIHAIGLMGVPIFLMLTGALLLNKKISLPKFFKRRFSRICFPFIFWVVIILASGFLIFNWNLEIALRRFMGEASILWYFWTLIGIYLFIPIINSFIREYQMKGLEYFLIIWFFTILLKTFQLWPLFPPFEFNFNFELNYFTDFIGFVILGYYLDNKDFKINSINMLIISCLTLIISIGLYDYLILNHVYIGPVYQNLINVFMAIGIFLFIKQLDKLNILEHMKDNLIGKLITSLSIYSYGIYFVHFIIYHYFMLFDFHSNKIIPIMILIVLGISWFIIWILSKIPYINRFSY